MAGNANNSMRLEQPPRSSIVIRTQSISAQWQSLTREVQLSSSEGDMRDYKEPQGQCEVLWNRSGSDETSAALQHRIQTLGTSFYSGEQGCVWFDNEIRAVKQMLIVIGCDCDRADW